MSRFVFEFATERDDPSLRRLIAASEMEGDINISFRREPNYFYASSVQGSVYQVVVVRDTETGELIGVGTRAVRPSFLNGKLESIGYLCDLRLDAPYRGGLLVRQAYRYLENLHQDGLTRLYFSVIAEGNQRALKTIASGRAGLPVYRDLGRLLSPALNLLRRMPQPICNFEIARGSDDLLPEIVECLNRNHQRRQFAPYYTLDQFRPKPNNSSSGAWGSSAGLRLRDFKVEDFYAAIRDSKVIGVVGKWDQIAYKQTVVTRYRGKLRLLRPFYSLAAPLINAASYPAPGIPLSSFYASFIAVDNDDTAVFRALLRRLYNDHVNSGYNYLLVGLHERDPLCKVFSDYSVTPFSARLFAVHFADGDEPFSELDSRIPYVELAML